MADLNVAPRNRSPSVSSAASTTSSQHHRNTPHRLPSAIYNTLHSILPLRSRSRVASSHLARRSSSSLPAQPSSGERQHPHQHDNPLTQPLQTDRTSPPPYADYLLQPLEAFTPATRTMTTRQSTRTHAPSSASTSTSQTHAAASNAPSAMAPPRRNLFSQRLSKRPPANPHSASTAALGSVGEEVPTAAADERERREREMVVTDDQGRFVIDGASALLEPPGGQEDACRAEKEHENNLIEAFRQHQKLIEPNELKATLQASLLAKVLSLEDDKWMFEGEDPVQG